MAHCVITAVGDTGQLRTLSLEPDLAAVPACAVHGAYAPCPHYGEPAVAAAIHVPPWVSRDEGLRMWHIKTHRQRPLVIHHDDPPRTIEDHVIDTQGSPCWCGAETLPAEGDDR